MKSIGQKVFEIMNTPRGKYRYIGNDPKLKGHTALGELRNRIGFCVQVEDTSHPYSRGWHLAIREDWELIKD